MEKSSSAFRTISEVAAELAVPKHVLRFWEGKFPQLRPMKRGGGRRYYRPEDVDLLRGIRWLLYSDGYTIKGVQRILRDSGVRFVKECWRGEPAAEAKPAEAPMPIPNLAGEAAKEARRGKAVALRPARGAKADAPPAPQAEPEPQGQRAMLAALLKELEECRDLLRGTTAAHAEKPAPAPARKGRGESRRGLEA
ncbi:MULTISPECIES: MerR family transcriptional regulator [Rhodomicrobium]|uniref:MerR family transcriptional regulator n=1 Tax=Rhodomicrobium TaxID=1068 RepID=UPI000B4BBBDA|nr:MULTISPECIES: MerR family transcriptional regulator [Rhodomicrobium]